MPMLITIRYLFVALLVWQSLKGAAAGVTNVVPTAVVIEFDRGRIKYEVDSKRVRSEDILEVLGEVKKKRGQEAPMVILIDQRNSLAALSNVRGVINKIGFSSVRYFSFTADRQMMEEIAIDRLRAVPFSLNPAFEPPPAVKRSPP